MSQPSRTLDQRQFIETCLDLKLLNETDAKSLDQSIGDNENYVGQTALQRGLLTPADVDIVQSLQRPTEVVPGYRILNLVGRGGMGVVYRAEQLDLEKTVALKTILISNISDPNAAARFEREAKALARLQHPNIVQAFNFGQHEGRYYFAMEYVAGQTCEQALQDRGLMSPQEVWAIVRQVASGLLHAFGHNLIHRDIKPANLILLPPPEGLAQQNEIVKITDFGLAMFADQGADQLKLTTGDKIMGSPAYMSLEQFGGRQVDFRTDMYSLGATAWHLLFGKPPVQGSSIAALFQEKTKQLVVDPTKLPVRLPQDQMQLLLALLDPDPNQRPRNYEQLLRSIDALGVCETTSPIELAQDKSMAASKSSSVAMSETIDVTAPKEMRQNRLRWLLVASTMLALLVVAAVAWLTRSPSRGPRTYTQIAGVAPLYDGVTLSGWDVGGSMVGAWNTVEAPDSSSAIGCTTRQGALTRRLPDIDHPRISLFVWLQKDSGPVDIDFGIDSSDSLDTRGCLRLTGESTSLGKKESDFDDLDVVEIQDALTTIHDRYHVVHIERQPTDWYIFLEEQLIGTVSIDEIGNGDSIRLVIHGSNQSVDEQAQAFFADVQLYELREVESE